MDTGKPKGDIEIISGSGGSNNTDTTNAGTAGSNSNGSSNHAGINTGTTQTHSNISQAVQVATQETRTDLFFVNAVIISITVLIVSVAAVVRMFRVMDSVKIPELRIDMNQDQFAAEMLGSEGSEVTHFSEKFANEFFQEEIPVSSEEAALFFAEKEAARTSDQFAADMFAEQSESTEGTAAETKPEAPDENYWAYMESHADENREEE